MLSLIKRYINQEYLVYFLPSIDAFYIDRNKKNSN